VTRPNELTHRSILVVEDDDALRDVLVMTLSDEGFEVRAVGDGEAALAACAERLPDLVVLDVMLPMRGGIEACALLRRTYSPSPGVVMVSARGAELDVVLGLDVGADDYVLKPCRPRELVARVHAVARRLGPLRGVPAVSGREDVIARGELRIDELERKVRVLDTELTLTPSEFALLVFLARHPGRVFTRLELLEQVFDTSLEAYSRNVDSHIARIRKKLEQAGMSPPIRTVHGVGYAFDEPRGK